MRRGIWGCVQEKKEMRKFKMLLKENESEIGSNS
jgi:hypothetical protein